MKTQILVKGYEIKEICVCGDVQYSTLFAVFPDGTVQKSNRHPTDTQFNRPSRIWTPCEKEVINTAEFIGNYDMSVNAPTRRAVQS